MLLLIISNRHMGSAIGQNVRRHQYGIVIEADRRILAVFARFLLKLGHAVQPAHARHAVQHPGEFPMGGYFGLVEDDLFLCINTGGNIGGCDFACVMRQFFWILPDRDRVHIHNAIDAFMGLLQTDEIADRAQIVSEMQISGGLNPRKHTISWLFHLFCSSLLSHRAFSLVAFPGRRTAHTSPGSALLLSLWTATSEMRVCAAEATLAIPQIRFF